MLWRVRVECFRKDVTHPVIRRFVVDAENEQNALAQGLAAAGPVQWERLTAREAVIVTVPLEI